MPFPATWTEELVCEFLELERYFVITNRRVAARREMDVVGIKLAADKKSLKIVHVEIGIPTEISYEKINSKFGQECKDEVEKIACDFGFKEKNLERWYIDVARNPKGSGDTWEQTKRKLKEDKIDLLTFYEFFDNIRSTILEWQKNHPTSSRRSASLPENLWLLKLLEILILLKKL